MGVQQVLDVWNVDHEDGSIELSDPAVMTALSPVRGRINPAANGHAREADLRGCLGA